MKNVGRGSIKLPALLGAYFEVHGGPYYDKPDEFLGVKMATEIRAQYEVNIPTEDFRTPSVEVMTYGVERTLQLIAARHPVYAGCMGGIGRTGLVLAVLAKAFGIKDPVGYVRTHYYAHAVETAAQREYVDGFVITKNMRRIVFFARLRGLLKPRSNLTHLKNVI